MEPFHAALLLTVSLFVVTFLIRREDLFVVVQTNLPHPGRRRAGVITGTGVATGDAFLFRAGAFRSACDAHCAMRRYFLTYPEIVEGGACYYGSLRNSIRHRATPQIGTLRRRLPPVDDFFRRGLMTGCQSANRTVLSVFSVTLSAETPTWAG